MTIVEKLACLLASAVREECPEIAQTCRDAIDEIDRLQEYEWMYQELCR